MDNNPYTILSIDIGKKNLGYSIYDGVNLEFGIFNITQQIKLLKLKQNIEGRNTVLINWLNEIKSKHMLDGSVYAIITQIASSDLINSLSSLEIFTLLWFVTCKNTFCFEKGIYYNMTINKTVGNLLKKLSSRQ